MALHTKPTRRVSEQKQAALDEVAREETTRLNILIPESLHRDLRQRAVDDGKGATITNIVIRATRAYLDETSGDDDGMML